MTTDTKETAERLRVEADHGGEDTAFNMPNCRFTESVPKAFGMDGMGICADTPVYGLFDKPADLIDPQSS